MMSNSKIEIGKIVNTHGLRGTLKVQPWTDYPEVFEEIETVYTKSAAYIIRNVAYQKNGVLLSLEGVETLNQAEVLKNEVLFCERTDLGELPDETYYITDLIGCTVYENSEKIGVVADVINTGGVDLYEIKREDGAKPFYLPAAKEIVQEIDISSKTIQVKLPEGIMDL